MKIIYRSVTFLAFSTATDYVYSSSLLPNILVCAHDLQMPVKPMENALAMAQFIWR